MSFHPMTKRVSREHQKLLERNQFQWFADSFLRVPAGEVTQPDPPEPDIVVLGAHGRLGIEITEIHPGGTDLRRLENEHVGITAAAGSRFLALGRPGIAVYAYWDPVRPIRRADREPLTLALLNAVLANMPDFGNTVHLERRSRYSPALPEHIERMIIDRSRVFEYNHWVVPRGGPIRDCTIDDVQARIDDKNTRLAKHRGTYVQRWLLVVAGSDGPSTWGGLGPEAQNHLYRSAFDRVFFTRLGDSNVIECRVDPDRSGRAS